MARKGKHAASSGDQERRAQGARVPQPDPVEPDRRAGARGAVRQGAAAGRFSRHREGPGRALRGEPHRRARRAAHARGARHRRDQGRLGRRRAHRAGQRPSVRRGARRAARSHRRVGRRDHGRAARHRVPGRRARRDQFDRRGSRAAARADRRRRAQDRRRRRLYALVHASSISRSPRRRTTACWWCS